jgi:hypothetical protein
VLDKKTEAMLRVANALTADDLDCLRGTAGTVTLDPPEEAGAAEETAFPEGVDVTDSDERGEADHVAPSVQAPQATPAARLQRAAPSASLSAGEYERQRTRESKVATGCLGKPREGHDWWPLGTELVGRIGSEQFTAVVVENPQVKSGRSLRISSGAAAGRICITPTRAAIDATEDYRQTHKLGRGGGITNGWEFWSKA